MEKLVRNLAIPAVVAGGYAGMVLFLFIVATTGHDEFGFRYIPVVFGTFPLSSFLQMHSNLLQTPSILIGGCVNMIALFALAWFFGQLKESSRTK